MYGMHKMYDDVSCCRQYVKNVRGYYVMHGMPMMYDDVAICQECDRMLCVAWNAHDVG